MFRRTGQEHSSQAEVTDFKKCYYDQLKDISSLNKELKKLKSDIDGRDRKIARLRQEALELEAKFNKEIAELRRQFVGTDTSGMKDRQSHVREQSLRIVELRRENESIQLKLERKNEEIKVLKRENGEINETLKVLILV